MKFTNNIADNILLFVHAVPQCHCVLSALIDNGNETNN